MTEGARGSAATSAAEQVKAIVGAAEQSAVALEAAAREEAESIRAEAQRDAASSREAVVRLAERADQLERRLDELAEAVRDSVAAMRAELEGLAEGAAASGSAGAERQEVDEELIAAVEEITAKEPDVKSPEGAATEGAATEVAETAAAGETAAGHAAASGASDAPRSSAPEGARVLALKMALDGSSREETARYLSENFTLDDPDGLLDEVYAKAGR